MANPATVATNDSSNRGAVTAQVIAITRNPSSNTSTVTWSISVTDGNASAGGYNFNSPNGSGGIATGGLGIATGGTGTLSGTTSYNGGYGSYDFGSGVVPSPVYPKSSGTLTATITHVASTGTAGPVYATGTFNGQGPAGDATATTDNISIASFAGPSRPTAPSISRTGTGGTINVTSQTPAANSLSITKYQYRWSYDNATWNQPSDSGASAYDMTGTSASFSAPATSVVYIQTRAISTTSYGWGTGAWSPSASAYAVPFITDVSRVGTNVTVTVAPAASNGGSTITGHVVEYSTDQTTWSGAQTISGASGGSTTFTSLPPGKTYYIRAYATNQASVNSPYQTYLGSPVTANLASIFVSAYGRRYFTSGAITNVTTSSGDITYTASNSFSANDKVTITGVTSTPADAFNLTNATIKSATSTQFVITNAATGTYSSSTGTASGWALVLSGKRIDSVSGNITNVTTSGGDITYTASNNFVAGDNVSISGVNPSAFNLVNATIKSATSTQFVITNAATGTYSTSTGKAGRLVTIQNMSKYTAGAWTAFS